MEQGGSKPLRFPAYRRSHFRSQTYLTLVRFFSNLPVIPDNGCGRNEQEISENGPKFSELVGSASVDAKDPISEKIRQEVHETTEGVGDKGKKASINDVILRDIKHMLGIKEVEDPFIRKLHNTSKQTENFNKQQRLMDNLVLVVEGNKDIHCDDGLISLNSGQGEKRDGSNEVELMNYQVDGRLLGSALPKDKLEMQNEENKGEMEEGELAPNSSSIMIEKRDKEDGELGEDFAMDGACDSVLKPGSSKDENQDHGNPSASKVGVIYKKKHSLGSEERKAKRKEKKRKNREEKNRQHGVKRLKFASIQKSKTISYCRHYLVGRCHEGDNCKFSHDTVPLTKSTPCRHFARGSCMKGDDCPYDHELSKYPCNNFVTKGFCRRGDACLFSHQVPTKEDSPTSLKVCRPELKSPLLSGNTSLSVPPDSHGNSAQKNHLNNSMGIHSLIKSKDELTLPPKGIRFINIGKSSLPNHSTPEKGLISPNKECLVHIGVCFDQSTSGTNQTLVEIPKKLPTMALKGVNILCFGKGSVYSFQSSLGSISNKENGIKGPKFVNFGLRNNASSSLRKVDYSKSINGANQSVPRIDIESKGIQSSFPGKGGTCDATTDLRGSSYSHADHNHSKSVQEAKEAFANSQTSTATSCMLLVSQFGLRQSSNFLPFRNHENAWNLCQTGFLSTLAFAANESSIR